MSPLLLVIVLANLYVESESISSFGGVNPGKKRNQLPGSLPSRSKFLCPRCGNRKMEMNINDEQTLHKKVEPTIHPSGAGIHCMKGTKGDTGEKGEHGENGVPGPPGQKGEQGKCNQSQIDAFVKPLEAKLEALFSLYTKEIARVRSEVRYLKSKFVHTLGSETNPAKSCKEIYELDRFSPSGAYYLNVTGVPGGITKAFCYMEEVEGCPAGSTLVLKIDGTKKTFLYSSPLWTNKELYNPDDGTSIYDSKETKLATYWSTSFSKVCVRMRTSSWSTRTLVIDEPSQSLYDLIADGNYRPTKGGRDIWKSILPGSSLQKGCLQEGFNAHGNQLNSAGSRIGAIADDQPNCLSPDSFIGFGTTGGTCGVNKNTSCGNEAGCNADNGNKHIQAFGYVFVH